MSSAWLGLGSNSPDALAMLALARRGLAALADTQILACSRIYETEPQGFADQPWFRNQVVKLRTLLAPRDLLAQLLALEARLGRRRSGPRFGPRCIDIDLLLYGEAQSADPFCTLPHPRLCQRAFCLVPMLELEPELSIGGIAARVWLERLAWRREGDKIFQ